MDLSPYLNFNGDCAAAFKLYEQILGGKIVMMMTHGESPMKDHVAADWQDKIMHATLAIGDKVLMGMDAPPAHYAVPQGISLSITVDAADAERIFKALAENGKITMPFQQTFWASGFGMAIDRFGIPWMVSSAQAAAPAGV